MKKIIIIGGSKGIGSAIIDSLITNHKIINLAGHPLNLSTKILSHFNCDVLKDELPPIESADGLIYCPGSINLKPFNRLSLDDFRADFEINVIGAIKCNPNLY